MILRAWSATRMFAKQRWAGKRKSPKQPRSKPGNRAVKLSESIARRGSRSDRSDGGRQRVLQQLRARETERAGKSGFRTTTCRSEGGVSFSPASCIGSPQREGNGETHGVVESKCCEIRGGKEGRGKGYKRGSMISPVDRDRRWSEKPRQEQPSDDFIDSPAVDCSFFLHSL